MDPLLRLLTPIEQAALEVFSECQTQWHVVAGFGGGGRTGLRYDAVRAVADSHGYEWSEDFLRLIQLCERAVLKSQWAKMEAERNAG